MTALLNYFHTFNQTDLTITFEAVIKHSTLLHAGAVNQLLKQTGFTANHIDVIGYHGQTLFHRPNQQISVIVGDGQLLANLLGITVVNDFRSKDIAAGGQGAPLAPIYHQALAIRDHKIPAVIVNCGGIANVTVINNDQETDLIGFDTGPGNALIDRLIRQRTQGQYHMDRDGQFGQSGKINNAVLGALYEKSLIINGQNYFAMKFQPKSLDYGDMTLIPELNSLSLEDACATLEAFTADSIINSFNLINAEIPKYWILAGGGWNNPIIRQQLQQRLIAQWGNAVTVMTAEQAGWSSQAMEAQLFAFLAVRSLQNKPLSVPGTTRVPKPLSGGQIYFPASKIC